MTEFLKGLDTSVLTNILIAVIPALICLTVHEVCHGLAAYALGDTTAKDAGRLTLNPIKHLDPLGVIMMIAFKFGWAKPVPVDMRRFKNPKSGMAITALAGPASNIVLAALVMLITGFLYIPLYNGGKVGDFVLQTLLTTAYLSCALAIFNMIPIPPLDGSKILFSLLPDRAYHTVLRYERFGFIVLLALVYLNTFSSFLSISVNWIYNNLFHILEWSFSLTR